MATRVPPGCRSRGGDPLDPSARLTTFAPQMPESKSQAPRTARRSCRLELALHQAELEQIQSAALTVGHTPAAWVRHLALTQAPPAPAAGAGQVIDQRAAEGLAALARHAHDLARHGNLLNQMVTHLNLMVEAGQLRDPRTAADAVRRVSESRGAILQLGEQIRELRALLLAKAAGR